MDFNHKLIKLTIHRSASYSRSRCALKYESYFCNFALIEGMQQLSVDRKKDNSMFSLLCRMAFIIVTILEISSVSFQ